MKNYISFLVMSVWSVGLLAQAEYQTQKFAGNDINEIYVECKWADINFEPFSGQEIILEASVNVGNGEYNQNFDIKTSSNNGRLSIITDVKNIEDLPKTTIVKQGDKKYEFSSSDKNLKKKIKEIEKKSPENTMVISNGFGDVEVRLTIKVPSNIRLQVQSKYGDINLKELNNPMVINNTYGHIKAIFSNGLPKAGVYLNSKYEFIDVTVPVFSAANVDLRTNYGKIFTDLDIDIDSARSEKGSYTNYIIGQLNGGGSDLELSSKYGKVYLRALSK